jgi:hypothetical protein
MMKRFASFVSLIAILAGMAFAVPACAFCAHISHVDARQPRHLMHEHCGPHSTQRSESLAITVSHCPHQGAACVSAAVPRSEAIQASSRQLVAAFPMRRTGVVKSEDASPPTGRAPNPSPAPPLLSTSLRI